MKKSLLRVVLQAYSDDEAEYFICWWLKEKYEIEQKEMINSESK